MWKYWLPSVIGVLLALFSDDLTRLCGGDKRMKKVILTVCAGVVALCMIAVVASVLD